MLLSALLPLLLLQACQRDRIWTDSSDTDDSSEDSGTDSVADTSDTDDTSSPERETWNFLVFLNADNDLDKYTIHDLNELEQVGSSEHLNVLVQVDRSSSAGAGQSGARRMKITEDATSEVVSPTLEELGEVDMGSAETVADFLSWASSRYPADHTVIVFWDHGDGWWARGGGNPPEPPSFSYDDTSGTYLSVAAGDLDRAFSAWVERHGPLDVIAFDACNMASWEVSTALQEHGRAMVASQASVGGEGIQYAWSLSYLRDTDTPDARGLAERMALTAVSEGREATFSAMDLEQVAELTQAVDHLASAALGREDLQTELLRARDESLTADRWWPNWYIDLMDLARQVEVGANEKLVEQAREVQEAMGAVIIGAYGTGVKAELGGLTVFFDLEDPKSLAWYQEGRWAAESAWDDLLLEMAD